MSETKVHFGWPAELLERMEDLLGEEFRDYRESLSEEGWQALRFKMQTTGGSEESIEALRTEVIPGSSEKVPWEKNAWYYDRPDTPGKSVWHDIGLYYIQEPSAMIPVPQMGIRPGERVLDLCAAPGGKTAQIAQRLQGKGLLVSNEPYPDRAAVLSQNMERLGIRNTVVTNEMPGRLLAHFGSFFDRILADAPCSGEGMMRRHPEVRAEWNPGINTMCAARQQEILACAAGMLKPGGTIVYSTCTFAPEENERTIAQFLKLHPDFTLGEMEIPGGSPGIGSADFPLERTVRIWPHRTRGEGHFIALLKKACSAEVEQEDKRNRKKDRRKTPDRESYKLLCASWEALFDTEKMPVPERDSLVCFGDNIWLPPEGTGSPDGLKIKRCGLEIASVKKGRISFSHALAMAVSADEVRNTYAMSAEEVLKWMNGETIPHTGQKGYVLMTASGFPAGFGTCDGRQIKNHYPKGLRKRYDPSFRLL